MAIAFRGQFYFAAEGHSYFAREGPKKKHKKLLRSF